MTKNNKIKPILCENGDNLLDVGYLTKEDTLSTYEWTLQPKGELMKRQYFASKLIETEGLGGEIIVECGACGSELDKKVIKKLEDLS